MSRALCVRERAWIKKIVLRVYFLEMFLIVPKARSQQAVRHSALGGFHSEMARSYSEVVPKAAANPMSTWFGLVTVSRAAGSSSVQTREWPR